MKCSNVRKEIERLVYQDNPDPGSEIYGHIGSCKACAQYLEETRLTAGTITGIRDREPVLINPDGLTDDIMNAIRNTAKLSSIAQSKILLEIPVIIILRRLLAAASVCLFLVFGYEEYVVVDKISRLEKQNAVISKTSQYQAALKIKKVMSILASDPVMMNQYKELKTRKISLRTLLGAVMFADLAAINPDALNLLNRTDYNIAKSPFISVLKQFDSVHFNIQR